MFLVVAVSCANNIRAWIALDHPIIPRMIIKIYPWGLAMSRRKKQLGTYRVRCEKGVDDECHLRLSSELIKSMHWEVDDVIRWSKNRSKNKWTAINLSTLVIYGSRFRRNYRSLSRSLNNPRHSLKRVCVKCTSSNVISMVAISADNYSNVSRDTSESG